MSAQISEAPLQANAAAIKAKPGCVAVKVKTADGRTFNLGRPDSMFFPLRRWFYLWRRRHELKEAAHVG